jgi:hypothetical protein
MSAKTPAVLNEISHDFPQFHHENDGIATELGQHYFLPDYFQFIINTSFYHSALYII